MGLRPLGSAALRPKIEYGGGQAENTGAGTSWTTKNQGQRVSPSLSMGTQDHSHGMLLPSLCGTLMLNVMTWV